MKHIKTLSLAIALIIGMGFTNADKESALEESQDKNIVTLASETSSLSTLVKAVKAAGLVETLSGEGPFTVFAPTNDAFAALPEGTLDNLLKPENKDMLTKILTYHVVPGKVMASDLEDGQMVTTVAGEQAEISLSDGGAMVNEAGVAQADIEASNGVVHVIDAVIMPPEEDSGGDY
jgi:uncharacterized surface protein with fasciclin (FAS1) repeats